MRGWLNNNFFEDHPLIKFVLIYFFLGFTLLALHFMLKVILKRLSFKNKMKFDLIRNIVIGLTIPIVGTWIWFNSSNQPFDEYLLITNSQTVKGFITEVEEQSEIVEYNDGRSADLLYFYYYKYNFTLPNGKIITNGGKENGTPPDYLVDVTIKPHPVEVEYLSDDPEINRLKGLPSRNKTIYEWLQHDVFIGVIILAGCSFFCILIIKNGVKEYLTEAKIRE